MKQYSDLNQVKLRIKEFPISQIIGQFISLQVKGDNHWCICPFHQDKRPSMSVNDRLGLFKCFSCEIAGDAIVFLQRYKQLTYPKAIEEICSILQIPFNDQGKNSNYTEIKFAKKLMATACLYYFTLGQETLKSKDSSPQSSLLPFLKERKLSEHEVNQFLLGFAPMKNSGLLEHLVSKASSSLPNYSKDEIKKNILSYALKIGLIRANDGIKSSHNFHDYYEVFQGRIIFPIRNQSGDFVGISARAITDWQRAKYINSKDSIIFNKKWNLYGINLATKVLAKAKRIFLVEGQMDVISFYKNGIHESVGLMGVGLSKGYINLFKRLGVKVYMALDSDEAGRRAEERISEELMKSKIMPYHLDFGPYKDPDEFFQENERKEFQDLVSSSLPYLDYFFQRECELIEDKEDMKEKFDLLEKVFRLTAHFGDDLYILEKLTQLIESLQFKIDTETILKRFKKSVNAPKLAGITSFGLKQLMPKTNKNKDIDKHEVISYSKSCKELIRIIVLTPSILFETSNEEELLEFVPHLEVKGLVRLAKSIYQEVDDLGYGAALRYGLDATDFFYGEKSDSNLKFKEMIYSFLFQKDSQKSMDQASLNKIDSEIIIKDLRTQLKKDELVQQRKNLVKKIKQTNNQQSIEVLISQTGAIDREIMLLNKGPS